MINKLYYIERVYNLAMIEVGVLLGCESKDLIYTPSL